MVNHHKKKKSGRGIPWLILFVILVAIIALYRARTPEDRSSGNVPVENNIPEEVAPVTTSGGTLTRESSRDDSIRYYISRLGDSTFIDTYGDGFTWYIAAEELGLMGRPAIPALISMLDTQDDYERTQALYALRLAAQHENMRELTDGDYIDLVADAFPPPETHPALIAAWKEWYRKYLLSPAANVRR